MPVEKIIERVVEIPVYKEKIVERLVTKEVEVEKMVYEEKAFDKVIEVPPNYAAIETTLLASNAAMLDSTPLPLIRMQTTVLTEWNGKKSWKRRRAGGRMMSQRHRMVSRSQRRKQKEKKC